MLKLKDIQDLYKAFIGIQFLRLLKSIIQMILFWTTRTFCNRLFAAVPHAKNPYLRCKQNYNTV